ncbi:DUF3781 domain-containing protein [Anaerosporobacter faecicola]|uniref:DUF3781 domain-containing protein n=1 Tax=Anaerosporobacter faecicola TaxID=2718714 RepID=UPI00143A7FE3|nr:DUF3781 domain-containing protein [Anaerosporobacter faecicola]
MRENEDNKLLMHLTNLHTTELGIVRIRRNLGLEETIDVVSWCRKQIERDDANIHREGKNWYIQSDEIQITVNAYSYTIITAHRKNGVKRV